MGFAFIKNDIQLLYVRINGRFGVCSTNIPKGLTNYKTN